jgi:hypothetical protein
MFAPMSLVLSPYDVCWVSMQSKANYCTLFVYCAAVFQAVGASPDGYYSAAAAAEVAFEYAKQAQLDQMAPDNR